jgi:DNA polymerase-3 subunit gamma/tau
MTQNIIPIGSLSGYIGRSMSYLVFARKYRPQRFEDIVAQEHVSRTLQNAVKNNRIGSGYLFCGPRGTGKTTTARILAKALNCVNGPTPSPCGECPPCREIAVGSSLDVLEIDAASNTGVDDVRTLRENVRYLPTGGKKRIYIIDEVHRLSGAAFDALLKTLEEPPPHVIFIFATTEPLKVPETILSRTQRFDFRRVSTGDLVEHLRMVVKAEQLNVEDDALQLLARKADGSVRDSLSLLDQVVSFAGDTITRDKVVEALGLVDRQMLFDFAEAVAAKDSRKVLQLTKQILDGGVDVADFVQELLEHFRLLMILVVDKDSADVLHLSRNEQEEYTRQADNFTVGDLMRLMKIAADLNSDLRSGLDERLILELAGVKMAEMETTVRFEEILERLNQNPQEMAAADVDLFGRSKKSDVVTLSSTHADVSGVTAPAQAHLSKNVNAAQLQAGWETFLGFFRQKSPMLASQLAMAEIRGVKENQVHFAFPASGLASKQLVEKPDNLSLILTALREHFRVNLSAKFDINSNNSASPPNDNKNRTSNAEVKNIIENSPRLQTLLQKVDGEVIGIKKLQ